MSFDVILMFQTNIWSTIIFVLTVGSTVKPHVSAVVSRTVANTHEFRNALHHPAVDHIFLNKSLTLSEEDWGLPRPKVDRKVVVEAHEESDPTCPPELDAQHLQDLVFLGPDGGIEFRSLILINIFLQTPSSEMRFLPLIRQHGLEKTIIIEDCIVPDIPLVCSSDDIVKMYKLLQSYNFTNSRGSICDIQKPADSGHDLFIHDCTIDKVLATHRSLECGTVSLINVSIPCDYGHGDSDGMEHPAKEEKQKQSVQDFRTFPVAEKGDIQELALAFSNISRSAIHGEAMKIVLENDLEFTEENWPNVFATPMAKPHWNITMVGAKNGTGESILSTRNGTIIHLNMFGELHMANVHLKMPMLGAGLVVKHDPGSTSIASSQFCNGKGYLSQWPLFVPYSFLTYPGSKLCLTNVTLEYEACPSQMDAYHFVKSLHSAKDMFGPPGLYSDDYIKVTSGFLVEASGRHSLEIEFLSIEMPNYLKGEELWDFTQVEARNVSVTCRSSIDGPSVFFRCPSDVPHFEDAIVFQTNRLATEFVDDDKKDPSSAIETPRAKFMLLCFVVVLFWRLL
ncbi:hypothetical protein BSKO_03799 [Bryopsis sp. KO-2023]|nr:hypothetical protein BSKO_03799 [Bryopsis sp. KO-2023]